MKKSLSSLLALVMLLALLAGCGGSATPASSAAAPPASSAPASSEAASSETPAEPEGPGFDTTTPATIRYSTLNADGLDALNDVGSQLNALYPNLTVEVTVLPGGVAGFNTAMAAQFAANDAPDLFTYQWGEQISQYARGGHLLDLTDSGISEQIKPLDIPSNIYQGREYAYPLVQSVWGLVYNKALAESMGAPTATIKTFDQYLAVMDGLKKAGMEYPLIIPAKDGSGAIGFIQCYMPMVVVAKNPDYYYQVLKGENSFTGKEWTDVLERYKKLFDYATPDSLGLDPDNAYSRFARGEGAFIQASASVVKRLEDLNPDLVGKLEYIPYPVFDSEADYITCAQFDHATSIWSKSKYPEQTLAYYKLMLTHENAAKYAAAMNTVSAIKGTPDTSLDPSILNMMPLLEEGKFVGFFARDWVMGMKEIMKTRVQEWIAGESVETALANLEADHQRLLEAANPDFMDNYMDVRHAMGLPD